MSRTAVAAAGLAALVVAGCGVGPGGDVGPVSVVVTRDFGRVPLPRSPASVDAPGGETALRALRRAFPVRTRYGGGFVSSIGGVAGGRRGGRPVDWFFYVNGIESSRGAAAVGLHRGDVVWWDHHDWGAAMRIPAVVGAFPEPFRHGEDGKRLPVRVECAPGAGAECATVGRRLAGVGVVSGQASLNTRGGQELLRVLVGPWPALRADFSARLLERGAGASGVYARPARDGRSIAVLDARGRVTRTLGSGTGLIAATASQDLPPVWIVTGTDAAGLRQAAENLTPDALERRFAVAIADSLPIALPEAGR